MPQNDKVITTLYIPREVYTKLETYMTQFVGSQYGKNGVILLALREFLDRAFVVNPQNIGHTAHISLSGFAPNSTGSTAITVNGTAVPEIHTTVESTQEAEKI